MKRVLTLCLCAALLLTGCGRAETPAVEASPEPSAAVTVIQEPLQLPAVSPAESAAMASFMAANRALVTGDALYTLDFDAALRPVLARYRVTEAGLEDWTVLADDCVPEYLCEKEGALYWLNAGRLERLTLSDGTRQVLAEGPFGSLQPCQGGFYALDDTGSLLRLDETGAMTERLLVGPCDYTYVLGGYLFYQSEAEGGSLRQRRLCSGEDRRLARGSAYAPVLLGGALYFSGDGVFCRAEDADEPRSFDLPALRGAAELIPTASGWCARVALVGTIDQGLLTLTEPVSYAPCDYQGYRLCDFAAEGLRVDAVYEADGRLRCFALCRAEGELRYFGGRVLP